MSRPKNYAPLEMYGKYIVHVGRNKVSIKDDVTYKEVEVKCHPDDTFDIGEAIRIGMNRLNMDGVIRIGDTVKIIDNGDSYCTATDWDDIDKNYAIRYRFGVIPKNGTIGKVVRIMRDKFVIEVSCEKYTGDERFKNLICNNPIYLMDEKGLEKIKDGRYE